MFGPCLRWKGTNAVANFSPFAENSSLYAKTHPVSSARSVVDNDLREDDEDVEDLEKHGERV